MDLSKSIEAILFYKAEPMSISDLTKILSTTENELSQALSKLENDLSGRGIRLINNGAKITLATSPEQKELIEKIAKDELSQDLGKAGLETLAIIIYQGPISRSQIDYIRGVNSAFIVRNLLTRGLIERLDTKEGRGYLYKSSIELLAHLGISKIEDMPGYVEIKEKLSAIDVKVTEQHGGDTNTRQGSANTDN